MSLALGCQAAPSDPAGLPPTITLRLPVPTAGSPTTPRLEALAPLGGQDPAGYRARIDGEQVELTIATRSRPRPYRRPLAFYRLAGALGLSELVAPTRLYRAPLARLLGRLDDSTARALRERASVLANGTVAALVLAPAQGQELPIGGTHTEWQRWARLAASHEPLGPRDGRLIHDYVGMLVLDWLSANVLRQRIEHHPEAGRLRLRDNGSAFPGYVQAVAGGPLLGRLRPVVRFPRGLRSKLHALHRERLDRLVDDGPYEDHLLGPRQLADFAERRDTLLSLIDARVVQYGAAKVWSL